MYCEMYICLVDNIPRPVIVVCLVCLMAYLLVGWNSVYIVYVMSGNSILVLFVSD